MSTLSVKDVSQAIMHRNCSMFYWQACKKDRTDVAFELGMVAEYVFIAIYIYAMSSSMSD